MQNFEVFDDLLYNSSITIDIQVHDHGMFAISYKGKNLLNKGDSVSCKNNLREIVDDLTNYIENAKKWGIHPGSTIIFKIWDHGCQGYSNISFLNIGEIKSFVCSLRNSAKCNIEVRTSYHNFG